MLVFITLISCEKKSRFSEVKNLSEYPNTQFIPTLEHQITKDKNSVYCATLLFAWDEIRNIIHADLMIPDEFLDLKLLNDSKSFIDVLESNEYKSSGKISDNLITARAEFKKSLPFEMKLNTYTGKLTFDEQKVASFGVDGFDEYELLQSVKIMYYKDDNNFIVKLLPKDK
ncbi:MAG: hypothetical protein PHC38_03930, partial [Weeksellaceae bacterium]|nr:hypothetical protein [Weeksellaceae bacterium]